MCLEQPLFEEVSSSLIFLPFLSDAAASVMA